MDVLKIDIEGAEDLVLLPYIADASEGELPELIIIENSQNFWKQDLEGALLGTGYSVRMRSRLNTVYHRSRKAQNLSQPASRRASSQQHSADVFSTTAEEQGV